MGLGQWLNERTGIHDVYRVVLARKVPKTGWAYTLGSAALFVMVNQIITGILLSIYYVPTPDHAWDSVNYIQNEVLFGWLIRGLHHYGASAMVILVGLHMIRVVIYGAYKYPREVTWLTGVVLLIITMGFGFTGYLLPWDQKAYWATTVGTQFVGTTPVVGDWLLTAVRGGPDLSAVTLARFFGTHVWILPAALLVVVGIHLFLVIRLGISNPPWKKNQPQLPQDETEPSA
jgi:quinol-cytochrome oxidoreductase complex cytochrome b subunit